MAFLLVQKISLEQALQLTACISLVGVVISACEQHNNKHHYADEGLLSWKVSKYQGQWSAKGFSAKIADCLFCNNGFKWLLWTYLVLSVAALVLAIANIWIPMLWLMLVIVFFSLNLRSSFGLDGAHQMNLIVLSSLCMAIFFRLSIAVQDICLAFIAMQSALSYVIAGYWKLRAKTWREGSALTGIFSTDIYGNPFLYKIFSKHPQISCLTGWTVILFECSFPIVFFLNVKVLSLYLLIGLLFHLGTAIFMGLNGFMFAFISAYPALVYISTKYGLFLQ